MAGVEAGISEALAYARDDSHGYELRERDYGVGTDCAGLARLYAAAVEGVSLSSYPEMHTWDMRSVLGGRGWQALPFSESRMRRGDLLVREDPSGGTGHTVVYLGNRRIVGAEGDWDGRRGDSSGREVTERGYYAHGYKWILRPPSAAESEEEVTEQDKRDIAEMVWQVERGSWTADRVYRSTSILKAMCGLGPEDTSDPKDSAESIRAWTLGRLERVLRILKGMVGIAQDDTSADEIVTPMHVTLSDEQMAQLADMVAERIAK